MVENQPLVEAGVPHRQRRRLGRSVAVPVLHRRTLLPARLSQQSCASWLPALDGVAAKLERGAKVADVGCGHGFSTIIMAKAFPKSTFVGYDFHPGSVEQARIHAEQHGVSANTQFEVAMASDFPGKDLDLVTFFDCLHDMGDPVGAARHVRADAEAGRKLDDRRARGRRSAGGQSQSGQPDVLCGLDDDLHPDLARPAGRRGARGAGRLAKLSSAITQGGFARCGRRRKHRST